VFSGSPIVITQTTDGYLWIGTNIGLTRFDGVRFASWRPPAGTRLLDSRIFSLLGSRDGSLWIGTGYSISQWKGGELFNYPQLSGRIESIVEDAEGAVWLTRTQMTDGMGPLCRIKDDQLRCYGEADGIPFPLAIRLVRRTLGRRLYGTMSLGTGIDQYVFCEQVSTSRNICFATRDCNRSRWIGMGGNRPQSVVYGIRAI
jgi:hypothetical protein